MECCRNVNGRCRRSVARTVAIGGLSVLLLLAVAAGYIHFKMNYSLTSVLPGRLYRSSEMTPELLARAAARHGIATVIDLRHPELDDKELPAGTTRMRIAQEKAALTAAGIRHVSIPSLQRPNDEMVDAFLGAVADRESHPVLIHCDHGIGRAGLYTAVYLIEHAGYEHEAARDLVSHYYSARLHGRKHFRPDYNKGKWLMEYVPRLRAR